MSTDRRSHDPFAPHPRKEDGEQTQTSAPSAQPASSLRDISAIAAGIPADLDDITLKKLRALADEADLPDYGTKAEVAERIRAAAAS